MIRYTIDQSQPDYSASFSLSKVITDSFFSYGHLFPDIPSNDNAFSVCAGFASDRIGRVYVHSTNMADLILFHKTLTFRTIISIVALPYLSTFVKWLVGVIHHQRVHLC